MQVQWIGFSMIFLILLVGNETKMNNEALSSTSLSDKSPFSMLSELSDTIKRLKLCINLGNYSDLEYS